MLISLLFYFKLIIFYLQKTFNLKEKLMINELIGFFSFLKSKKYVINKIIIIIICISNNLFIISSMHILCNTSIYIIIQYIIIMLTTI